MRPSTAWPRITALMPPLEWMLGGTATLVAGFSEEKASPTALKTGMPSPVPTTASSSAASPGATERTKAQPSAARMRAKVIGLLRGVVGQGVAVTFGNSKLTRAWDRETG